VLAVPVAGRGDDGAVMVRGGGDGDARADQARGSMPSRRRYRSACTRLTAKWCRCLRSAARVAFDGHADAGLVFMRCAY
jgi:hypothetical protein